MACGKQFRGGERLSAKKLWEEYTQGKQTYWQLGEKYGCSSRTIQRKIDTVGVKGQTTFNGIANVLMDTTYFGRKFGVMVFKDSLTGQVLFKQYVRQESNKLYLSGIAEITRRGVNGQKVG